MNLWTLQSILFLKEMTKSFYVNEGFEHMKRYKEHIRYYSRTYLKERDAFTGFRWCHPFDPGRRDLLLPAAKAAIAIGADGVMAEVHPDPATALSDAQQQMDLDTFHQFMNELQK